MVTSITKNLCNDLNRLATINIITYSVNVYLDRQPNFQSWKDSFLEDIAILMVYHQALSYLSNYFKGQDSEMIDDFIKTGCLLLIPNLINTKHIDWTKIGTVLGGVAIYHKLIRPTLVNKMNEKGIGFNSGIEDLIETVLLLSMSRKDGLDSVISELTAIYIYHSYLRH